MDIDNRSGIAQIALSSLDARQSHNWYATGLGFLPAGDRQPTADLSAVQGIPNARVADLRWLVDANPFFQLEIFEYATPEVRPQPNDRRGSDVGYARFGVWVEQFDATLERLAELGTTPLSEPIGAKGHRRASVLDPDGIVVELMEDYIPTPDHSIPVRAGIPVAARSVTVSVPDLERSLDYFARAIGMHRVADDTLHGVEHEALWGLAGAKSRRAVLTGGSLWLEIVQYTEPVGRARPDDYRISDQGILNIAVASRTLEGFTRLRDNVVAQGFQVHTEIARDQMHIQYALDTDGFSVEMAYFDAAIDSVQGFAPRVSEITPTA